MYDLTHHTRPREVITPDFEAFKREVGLTEDQLFEARMKLLVPELTSSELSIVLGVSSIHGMGVFSAYDLAMSEPIAPVFRNGQFTLTGMMINHSSTPNCSVRESHCGDLWLHANSFLPEHTELTMDYREVG